MGGEKARGNAAYAEAEEPETDLERFRGRQIKIVVRDYFGSSGGKAARGVAALATKVLAAFEQSAPSAEVPTKTPRIGQDRLLRAENES